MAGRGRPLWLLEGLQWVAEVGAKGRRRGSAGGGLMTGILGCFRTFCSRNRALNEVAVEPSCSSGDPGPTKETTCTWSTWQSGQG